MSARFWSPEPGLVVTAMGGCGPSPRARRGSRVRGQAPELGADAEYIRADVSIEDAGPRHRQNLRPAGCCLKCGFTGSAACLDSSSRQRGLRHQRPRPVLFLKHCALMTGQGADIINLSRPSAQQARAVNGFTRSAAALEVAARSPRQRRRLAPRPRWPPPTWAAARRPPPPWRRTVPAWSGRAWTTSRMSSSSSPPTPVPYWPDRRRGTGGKTAPPMPPGQCPPAADTYLLKHAPRQEKGRTVTRRSMFSHASPPDHRLTPDPSGGSLPASQTPSIAGAAPAPRPETYSCRATSLDVTRPARGAQHVGTAAPPYKADASGGFTTSCCPAGRTRRRRLEGPR